MRIQETLQKGSQELKCCGIENPGLDARYLLEWILECDHSYVLLHPEQELSAGQKHRYNEAIEKRAQHFPLQYIIGEQEFMGYNFQVDENVLIPRQDTEILVEEALKRIDERPSDDGQRTTVLDLCCGSGCIGISVKKLRPETDVTLTDLSEAALRIAEKNADALQVDVKLCQGDLFAGVQGKKYRILLSNPPYIPSRVIDTLMPEVREYEPRLALDGADDGLIFYRRIAKEAMQFLEDEGYVLFEIGFDQAEDVRKILVDAGFEQIQVRQDYTGLDRVVIGRKAAE